MAYAKQKKSITRVAAYDTQSCSRCGSPVSRGQLVEPIAVPGATWVRWVHVGCQFPPGYVGLDSQGNMTTQASQPGKSEAKYPPPSSPAAAAQAAVDKLNDVMAGKGQQMDDAALQQAIEAAQQTLAEKVAQVNVSELVKHEFQSNLPSFVTKVKGQLYGDMTEVVTAELDSKITPALDQLIKLVTDRIEQEIGAIPAKVIQVEHSDGKLVEMEGEVLHECIHDVLDLVTCSPRQNVFVVGPTGCGKTHMARQLSRMLDLQFGSISCTSGLSESQLLGRSIPNVSNGSQEYKPTAFVERYEHGGVFLLDEADAADANVLLVLNAALANGWCPVPNRFEKPEMEKHPDFVCLISANTYGRGADRMYVGRNQIDEATLDRYRIGQVTMDYSPSIEKKVCPDAQLYSILAGWREKIYQHKLRRVLSTRFMASAHVVHSQKGWSVKKIQDKFFSGWSADELSKVLC